MKTNVFKILALCLSFLLTSKMYAQLFDPGNMAVIANQTTQINQAVQMLKQSQSVIEQSKQSVMQLVQIKQFLEKTSKDLENLTTIKQLKINDISTFMNEILCLQNINRYPSQGPFVNLSAQLQASLNLCDHTQLYGSTFGGWSDNLLAAHPTPTKTAVNGRQILDDQLFVANGLQNVGQSYTNQTQFELAFKYKNLSDQLMAISQELSAALNIEGAGMIEASKPERLQLMALAIDYQLKALEYEEKYANLLNNSSGMNFTARKNIAKQYRTTFATDVINFRQ